MKRFPIRRLMAWIAVIAVNLAVFRGFFNAGGFIALIGGGFASISIQVSGFLALKSRGGRRYFWKGWAVGGVLGTLSSIVAEQWPWSIVGLAWQRYAEVLMDLLESERFMQTLDGIFGIGSDLAAFAIYGAGLIFPLLVAAVIGGVSARLIYGRFPRMAKGTPRGS